MPEQSDKERLMREYEARLGNSLEEDPAVSRIYGSLNHPDPSGALDQSVLNEARVAASADRREARRRRWRSWMVPASAAAAVALLALLVMQALLPGQPDPTAPNVASNEARDGVPGASGERLAGPDVLSGVHVDYKLMLAEDPSLRPDSQAWFAGIRALRARGDLARADAERERFQRASAGGDSGQPMLPDPEVWAMGIDLLANEGDADLAAREREKLNTLFPGFKRQAEQDQTTQ